MRIIRLLILFLLLFNRQTVNGQILVRFMLSDSQKSGYGVEMFYYANRLDSILVKLNQIKHIDERSMLENIGVPIIDYYDIYPRDSCRCCSNNKFDVARYFRKSRKEVSIEFFKGTLELDFSLIKVRDIDMCVIPILYKVWASYSADFDNAVFIKNPKLKRVRFSAAEKKKMTRIKEIIDEK